MACGLQNGLDVYDPTTGEIRSSSTDDIACWFIDSDYNEESFFVRHAYFTSLSPPYRPVLLEFPRPGDQPFWRRPSSQVSRDSSISSCSHLAASSLNLR